MNVEWLASLAVAISLAVLGWQILAYNRQSDHISKVQDAAAKQIDLNPLVSRIAVVEGDMRTKIGELHVRANDIQRDYVRRDDFHREMALLVKQLEEIKAGNRDDTARINLRLDTILSILGRQAPPAE